MPQPPFEDVHVDAILTQISVAYIQSGAYIAHLAAPIIQVDKQSDKYFTFPKAYWFRDEAQRRGDAQESAGGGYTVSTDSYNCDVWAFHKDVGHLTMANYDDPLDPLRNAAQWVAGVLGRRREIQWATDFFATGIWDTDKTGGTDFTVWSDYTGGSTPIENIDDGVETVLENTGFKPNTLVLGRSVFKKLKRHPDLRDQLKYTGRDNVTTEMMAQIFELDRVLVCEAVKNTGEEEGDSTYDFIQGQNDALLCYVNPEPAREMPSAMYTFSWRGVSDDLGEDIGTSQFEVERLKAIRVESEIAMDHKVVATDLGYFFSGAVS
jgi:hypothetical protein